MVNYRWSSAAERGAKGYKSQTYPGGTPPQCFMWWKENFNPGNYDKLISAMDFTRQLLMQPISAFQKTLAGWRFLAALVANKKQGEPQKI